jgi:predicted transcriptional regulator
MSQSNDIEGRPTPVLVEAGEVLRTLNPPSLASLLFLDEHEAYKQQDIADTIGSARSSVSKYLQSLEELPLALATKQGHRYKITSAGEKIINHFDRIFDRFDHDLYAIDWQSDADYEQAASLLTPLYGSRSSLTFFVLDSIGTQSAVGERIDLFGKPQPVSIEAVIQDVTARQQERGERGTSKQIRQSVWRFEDNDAIEFDGDRITLRDKGHEHAYLLHHVAQLLEEQEDTASEEDETTARRSDTSDADQLMSSGRTQDTGNIARQNHQQGYFGRRASNTDQADAQEGCPVVPAYCLRSTDGTEIAILPITELTTGEMTDRSRELMQEYGDDTRLVPYWAVHREDELHPVGPMEVSANDQ